MTLVAVVSALSGLIPIAGVLVIRGLVDSAVALISGEGNLSSAVLWTAALVLVNLVENVQWVFNDWIYQVTRERTLARAEERLLAKAGSLSLAAFERPELYDQLHRARKALDERLFSGMNDLFRVPFLVVAVVSLVAFLATANPLIPLILLAGTVPFYIVTLRVYWKVWILARFQTQSKRVLLYLSELLTTRKAAAEVRLFGLGELLRQRRQELSSRLRRERYTLAREHLRKASTSLLAEGLTFGVVIAWVLVMILRGALTVGVFASYLAAFERFRAAGTLSGSTTMRIDADLRYLADLIDYLDISQHDLLDAPTVEDGNGSAGGLQTAADPQESPEIIFSGVSFTYPGSETVVLDGIDLSIEPGERVALVGRNGSGKTTLAKLLLALYRPTAGAITIGGVDVGDIEPTVLRRAVAAVFQDYMRFELTARDNIGFGDLSHISDQAAIESAAVKSGAAEFVATLPASYDTMLGRAFDTQGQDISAGQWQQLASARAYFREASVLALDEPTAALDAKAEVAVYRQFRDMSEGKSVLLISHRLGSARLADRIVFLDGGRIVEEGSHEELMALGGRYATMYSVQSEWYR